MGAAVEDGELRPVHLDEHIIDAQGVEGCQGMLYGAASHLSLAKDCAALGVNNVLCHSIYGRLARHINSLYPIAVTCRGGKKSYRQIEACMKSLAAERETFLEGILL